MSEDDGTLESENFVHSGHLNYNLFFEEVSVAALERILKFLLNCEKNVKFWEIKEISIDLPARFPYLSKRPKSVQALLAITKQDIYTDTIQVKDERGLMYIYTLQKEQISSALRYIHINSFSKDDIFIFHSYQDDFKSKFPYFRWIRYLLKAEEALSTLPIKMYICKGKEPYTVMWESVMIRRRFIK